MSWFVFFIDFFVECSLFKVLVMVFDILIFILFGFLVLEFINYCRRFRVVLIIDDFFSWFISNCLCFCKIGKKLSSY